MSQSASSLPDGDAEIVRLLAERQSIGLRSLLDRYGAITQSAIKKALGNSLDDAEIDEAMSTASYHAWRAIDTYEPDKGSLRAWFFVIARNAGRAILRDRQRRQWEPRGDAMAMMAATSSQDTDDEPVHSVKQRTFLNALRTCISRLPRLQRSVIEADLKTGDIADAGQLALELNTSKNSIYVSRSTARKTLSRTLTELGFGIDGSDQSWK
tara:strand:- start:184 stop:816 length:633 start_codon:yes stop_codon:yes gene_type:complete